MTSRAICRGVRRASCARSPGVPPLGDVVSLVGPRPRPEVMRQLRDAAALPARFGIEAPVCRRAGAVR